jgi:hypothetical protein
MNKVNCDLDVSLKGIDGLYYYKGSLFAIQNGTNPLRLTRFELNHDLDRIVKFEVIDRKHPAFGEPTLGVVVGHTLYYVANSQWSQYGDNGEVKPDGQLHDIVVLKYSLD